MKRPSPALVLSALALFVSLGGLGVAATGGNFILGSPNTADQQTQLTGTLNGNPMLRVNNAGTSGGARAIVGKMTSSSAPPGSAGVLGSTASTDPTAAGVVAQNTGGGPALSALVNAGAAPLSVNSSTKVTNLNADLLDGKEATDFAPAGQLHLARVIMNAGNGGTAQQSLVNAGPMSLQGDCSDNVSGNDSAIVFINPYLSTALSVIRSDGTTLNDPTFAQDPIINLAVPNDPEDIPVRAAYFVAVDTSTGDTLSGFLSAQLNVGGDCAFSVSVTGQ